MTELCRRYEASREMWGPVVENTKPANCHVIEYCVPRFGTWQPIHDLHRHALAIKSGSKKTFPFIINSKLIQT